MKRALAVAALWVVAAARAAAQEPGPAELDCLIEPRERVVLAASVLGVVESVLVERGDRVEPGQVVATLEASVERAMVTSARARAESKGELEGTEARLALEARRHARSQKLFQQGIVSDVDLDESESRYVGARIERDRARDAHVLAKLELARAEAALGLHTLRSPISGVVVRRILAPGEYADPPQVLELAQVDPLYVEVFAPARMLGQIALGAQGRVLPEDPIGGEHAARVIVVDPVVDAASGTFGVRLELPNSEHAIPAGLKCKVRF